MREQLMAKEESLRKIEADLKKKVNTLSQVTSMKKIIQDKNEEIKTLRSKLAKYDPSAAGVQEDDDDEDY